MRRTSLMARTKSRAFTMIEMSIVISLVALFAALIVPNLVSSHKSAQERLFVDSMKRIANEARESAISQNLAMHLSLNGDRLSVTKDTGNNQKGDELVGVDLIDEANATKFQVNGQEPTSGDWDLRFFPDGTADEGGVEVTIGQSVYALNVSPRGGVSVDDQLTDASSIRWEAGTYETR